MRKEKRNYKGLSQRESLRMEVLEEIRNLGYRVEGSPKSYNFKVWLPSGRVVEVFDNPKIVRKEWIKECPFPDEWFRWDRDYDLYIKGVDDLLEKFGFFPYEVEFTWYGNLLWQLQELKNISSEVSVENLLHQIKSLGFDVTENPHGRYEISFIEEKMSRVERYMENYFLCPSENILLSDKKGGCCFVLRDYCNRVIASNLDGEKVEKFFSEYRKLLFPLWRLKPSFWSNSYKLWEKKREEDWRKLNLLLLSLEP
jgi:hypothetical protein